MGQVRGRVCGRSQKLHGRGMREEGRGLRLPGGRQGTETVGGG